MFVPETGRHEREAIDEVCERMSRRFGSLDRREVGSVVYSAAEEFSDARVRDFVPILVEHAARERLASRQPGVPRQPGAHRRA